MMDKEESWKVKDGKVRLTREIIQRGKSLRGGWSNKQFRLLGVNNPKNAPKGWKKHLENLCDKGEVWLPVLDVLHFLQLKDAHLVKYKNIEGIQARFGKLNQEIINGKPTYYFKEEKVTANVYYSIRKMYADLNRLYNYNKTQDGEEG